MQKKKQFISILGVYIHSAPCPHFNYEKMVLVCLPSVCISGPESFDGFYSYLAFIDPLLTGDTVNSSRCSVTVGKHVAIAKQLLGKRIPAATFEVLLDYNNGNCVFYVIRVEMF
jgi:hypothetical protein